MPNPASPTASAAVPAQVLGALALELSGSAPVARDRLPQAAAGELAALVARDLGGFAPDAARLDLTTVGAHYDPIELLRPGWPLHRELDQLAARAPRDGTTPGQGRIIAFGSHEDRLPGALTPSPEYVGGPLRLVPFVLNGRPEDVAAVAELFERDLIETGMAGADTALAAQEAFGLRVEHARYLTLHDLLAMIAMQYDHAGMGPLWPVLETALLEPTGEAWLDQVPEPLVHYAGGEARIALFSPSAWQSRHAGGVAGDDPATREKLHRLHQHFEARQRQFATVLTAHGVVVNFVHCERGVDCLAALS
ncbi:hypothetical protein [Novilysobacter spongiicola]|uniref:Uncharacterized protein n=1 Tax=Lysobacter spongiicola DSM 21749 TaxID=1122188 RepID=A0A1T4Q5V2_9GAMM|nr:hypothetical protein [Lysobacter spongiicola]SJZ99140.1 hypothetical protein SAMN02745674_01506 [Lysobacter spongiicola DSM 21749]